MARMDIESGVPPYKLDVIPLTEGLDFNTATSLAKPGSLRDVLNYEFVDGAGLKRIDGMRLYDGNMRNRLDKVFFIVVTNSAISSNTIYDENPWLYLDTDDNPNNVPFGYICWNSTQLPVYDSDGNASNDATVIPFIRLDCPSYADPSFNLGNIKILNSAVLTITSGSYSIVTLDALTAAQKTAVFGSSSVTAEDEESTLLTYTQAPCFIGYYENTTENFGVNTAWSGKIEEATFCVGDAFSCSGTAALQVYPGDYVYINSLGVGNTANPFLVLKSEIDGSWSGGSATLTIVPLNTTSATEPYTRPTNLQFTGGSAVDDIYLYRNTSAAALDAVVYSNVTTTALVDRQPSIACMYRVDSELGALTHDAVFSVAEPATEGTLYDLTSHPAGVSAGDAEGMPIISGGAVKAIVPTKRGAGYTTAPTFTLPASGGTAATANNASLTKTINRTNWQFVHTGWVVPFREGNKKYGYLNKIDRYKDIDGSTYSASSSVTSLEASRLIGRITSVVTGASGWTTPNPSAGNRWENFGLWRNQAGATLESTLLENIDTASDSEYIYQKIAQTGSGNYSGQTNTVTLSAFPGLSAIPEGSSIKGIKVTAVVDDGGTTTTIPDSLGLYAVLGIVRQNETGGFVEKSYGSPQEFFTAGGNNLKAEITGGMASTTFTAGGTNSLFGSSSIPLEELLDPDFSIGLFLQVDNYSTSTAFEVRIDHVYIDVYYELPSVRYYFKSNATSHSGGDDIVLHGDLVDYVITSGSLEAGDAAGYMTIVNLRTTKADDSGGTGLTLSNSAVPYYTVLSDMDIYQDSGLTVKIGETSGQMTFNGFDSYKTIKQNGSRYTSVRANFFANDEYEAFYICSGAGRAGIWDGKYWSRIYAINPKQENSEDLDKPRHVGVHAFHLMLGYKSGSVLFSAPGEPSNFSAFGGAGEIGIGDKIHGFNRLQGNAFGVFCEESVHAITGTDVSNFATQIIVPNEGALEYSVASFGNRVIYTSKTGITTLDQSEKYGNFLGRRLSFDVNPWLIPRITSGAGLFTKITDFNPVFEAGNGYVCAYAVPHKNQYRLWFKDGLQLWMTLVADDMPKFTFVQYFAGARGGLGLQAVPLIPVYVDSQLYNEDSNGTLMCPDREPVFTTYSAIGYGEIMFPGIYSLDVGDCFDGGPSDIQTGVFESRVREAIPHYALINYQYLKNPFTVKTLRKVRLEGQSRGAAPLVVYTEDGYKTSAQEIRTTGTNISLPRTPRDEISLSFLPESTLANVAATGRVLSILVVGESLANDAYFTTTGTASLTSTRTTVPTPSHYLQAMLVQFEEGQEDA